MTTAQTSRTVWYSYTPAANAVVNLRVEGRGGIDSTVQVYELVPGSPLPPRIENLTKVPFGGNDDEFPGSDAAAVAFPVQQGRQYYIQVGQDPTSNDGAGGVYILQFQGPVCYVAGTLIRTTRGEVAVETLAMGDTVLTTEGEKRPVKWIGRQSVVAALADPVRSYPIRVAAGALGENVPSRDLCLSPDHALLIDGVLVQAGALVNGSTVTRVMNPEAIFAYYHVETDDHAIILAEGAPAETFVSNVTRRRFDNYAEYEALFGSRADFEAMADRDEPRAMSARQVPARIRARLAERAAVLMPVEAAA